MRLRRYFFLFVIVLCMTNYNAKAQQQCPPPTGANPIQVENCLQGTLSWQIPVQNTTAPDNRVEGYASRTSVNVGEQIRFYINVSSMQAVDIDIYRLGFYGGLGARQVYYTRAANVLPKTLPVPDQNTGLTECNWSSPSTAYWNVPTNAVSGVYVVKLTGQRGKQSYISFVVRDDTHVSDILFQRSVTTDQAYNNYPGLVDGTIQPCNAQDSTCPSPANGKSLYEFNSYGVTLPGSSINPQQAREVSFNRPYGVLSYDQTRAYQTAGGTLFQFDYNMIRFLEKEGYDVTYSTDVDTHAATDLTNGILSPGRHKVFLSVGHDEYWSWEMRDNIDQARNRAAQPLNLGFFTGNAVYWQIRFGNSSSNTQPANAVNRTMVGYKEHYADTINGDPFFSLSNPINNHKATNKWRENQNNQGPTYKLPEDELIGVMWSENPVFEGFQKRAIIAPTAPAWITRNMNFLETLDALIGPEADRLHPENVYTDRVLEIVADSPYIVSAPTPQQRNSQMTFYTRNSNNAHVFATGSIAWSLGLSNFYNDVNSGTSFTNPYEKEDAKTLTRNVLSCLINGICS